MGRAVIIIILLNISCSGTDMDPTPEETDPSKRPFYVYDAARNHYLLHPWNYGTPENSQKRYPLVIFLHGMDLAGDISYLNFLGYDTDDGVDDTVATGFQKRFPCFVLVPQTNEDWDYKKLIQEGEYIKKAYRIDTKRIYLIGYSMGGAGTYSFANAWYDYNGQLIAGIIRIVGQSQTIVNDIIADRTAIWLHIGLEDQALRVDVVRQAYSFLKKYHSDAVETTEQTVISGYPAKIFTLKIDNDDRIKLTEYSNADHYIVNVPFSDNNTLTWLFRHTL